MNNEDKKNLNLLSIFHYVVAGITALASCMPFVHVILGIAMVAGKLKGDGNQAPPEFMGWIFIIMGGGFILAGWAIATCMFLVGKKLKHRESKTFCTVVAAIECIFMPFGTILGVFTLVMLNKDSVSQLFDKEELSETSTD